MTFEELYDVSNPDEPVKVAEHKDIEDEGQTVLITERIIEIHTTATGTDGEKEITAGKEVSIVDTVTLSGLEVGTAYQLKGWQMVKDEMPSCSLTASVWKMITPLRLTVRIWKLRLSLPLTLPLLPESCLSYLRSFTT